MCPHGFRFQILGDPEAAITLSIGVFPEKSRQAQNRITFAQAILVQDTHCLAKAQISPPKHKGRCDLDSYSYTL